MEYPRYFLEKELTVKSIITFFYKELSRTYHNDVGENHDFWELVYVDKGTLEVYTGAQRLELSQGDIVFYRPNEFHRGSAKSGTAPNLVVISFECVSRGMEQLSGRSFQLGQEAREVLARMVSEGVEAFDPPVDSPHMGFPRARAEAPFGSEQIIKNYLEIFLIKLIRGMGEERGVRAGLALSNEDNRNAELFDRIKAHMSDNISKNLSLGQICEAFSISKTALAGLFRKHAGTGVKEYFNKMKIERAKALIREEHHNFTQIAALLGYSSVHYFSKHFKRVVDMTPTEYARLVWARYQGAGGDGQSGTDCEDNASP